MGHLPWEELERRQEEAAALVPEGSMWEHYKTRDIYLVIGHCVIEATDEAGVLYRPYNRPVVVFLRPFDEWNESVKRDGQDVPRFKRVGEE